MIQDIYPAVFHNSFENRKPQHDSRMLFFREDEILACYEEKHNRFQYPRCSEFGTGGFAVYLFSVDDISYFMIFEAVKLPTGYEFYSLRDIRGRKPASNVDIFVAFSAYHLWKWYTASRFCGVCGSKTEHDEKERAMSCPFCGNKIYPRINPAVIVGVKNGDRLLITRYRTGYAHNALVAGFTEFGETLEETVRREVMEEAGLKVKNIRYYKSQPWGIALDLLAGFFCEVDGDDTIHMDEGELKYAQWVKREEIKLQPSDYSLTNEMMKVFRDGLE